VEVSNTIALCEDCWKLQEMRDEPDKSLLRSCKLDVQVVTERTSYFTIDQSFCNSNGDGHAISSTCTSPEFIDDHATVVSRSDLQDVLIQYSQTVFVDIMQYERSFTHFGSKG